MNKGHKKWSTKFIFRGKSLLELYPNMGLCQEEEMRWYSAPCTLKPISLLETGVARPLDSHTFESLELSNCLYVFFSLHQTYDHPRADYDIECHRHWVMGSWKFLLFPISSIHLCALENLLWGSTEEIEETSPLFTTMFAHWKAPLTFPSGISSNPNTVVTIRVANFVPKIEPSPALCDLSQTGCLSVKQIFSPSLFWKPCCLSR